MTEIDMLTTRKANSTDCTLINILAAKAFPATYKNILSPEQLNYMFNMMYAPENILQQMNEGHIYFICYKDNEPCGYVSIEQQENDLFHLQKIYVIPDSQGCGAGRFLIKEAIKYIKEIHPAPCTMELNVNRNNKAFHFYERMGLKKLREGDFSIGNGYYMNDYIMGMEL